MVCCRVALVEPGLVFTECCMAFKKFRQPVIKYRSKEFAEATQNCYWAIVVRINAITFVFVNGSYFTRKANFWQNPSIKDYIEKFNIQRHKQSFVDLMCSFNI